MYGLYGLDGSTWNIHLYIVYMGYAPVMDHFPTAKSGTNSPRWSCYGGLPHLRWIRGQGGLQAGPQGRGPPKDS